jgi:hypothetical protein
MKCSPYDCRQWKDKNPNGKEGTQNEPEQLVEQSQLWLPFIHKSPIGVTNEENAEIGRETHGIKVEYGHGPASKLLDLAPQKDLLWTVLLPAQSRIVVMKGKLPKCYTRV